MIELKIEGLDRLKEKLERLNIRNSQGLIRSGLVDASLLVERNLKNNISGSFLHVRSNRLRSSIGSMVKVKENSAQAIIGSGVRSGERVSYANIHENGGTIRPKLSQFLTIPLKDAKTPAGVTRFSARALLSGQTSYSGSFIRKHIIFGVSGKGKGKKITPLFALKRSVAIPASHYMSKTLAESVKDVLNAISKRIREAMNK